MKGGNYNTHEAIKGLRCRIETKLPVVVLFTGGEGDTFDAYAIETEQRAKYVLCPEPAHHDNGVTTGRYAIARFNLIAKGKPSHAGARLEDGVSAVKELAKRILEIEEMTSENCAL